MTRRFLNFLDGVIAKIQNCFPPFLHFGPVIEINYQPTNF